MRSRKVIFREELTSWTTVRASSQVSLTPFKTQEMLLNHSKQQFANAVKGERKNAGGELFPRACTRRKNYPIPSAISLPLGFTAFHSVSIYPPPFIPSASSDARP